MRGCRPKPRTAADVAQLVERQVVVLDVVGSKPIVRPIFSGLFGQAKGSKASFFEKKEAKKLCSSGPVPTQPPETQINESFLLLFSKKEALPSLPAFSS